MISLDGPRYAGIPMCHIRDHRMGINGLQSALAAQLRHDVRNVERPRPEPRLHVRLFQVQCNPPPALRQCSSCQRLFVIAVGICACRRQAGQRVAYLARHLVAEIDRLHPWMLPVVLDFDQPSRIAIDAEHVHCLRTAGYGLELVAIERPFLVPGGFASIRERELEIAFLDLGHGMNSSTKRSDCPSSSSSRSSGSTSPTSLA